MELYEVKSMTAATVEAIRENSDYNPGRGKWGKTTALLIFAKELLDQGNTVFLAGREPRFHKDRWQEIHGTLPPRELRHLGPNDSVRGRVPGLDSRVWVLVDEPASLGWDGGTWSYLHAVVKPGQFKAVGSWWK